MDEYICPRCQKPINDDEALLCHFCGESLQRSGTGLLGKLRGVSAKWILVLISAIVILSFLALLFR